MKTNVLDLNAYGVEEMSVSEMRETDGGWCILLRWFIAISHPTGKEITSVDAMMSAI